MDCERLGTGNDFANAETKDFRIPRYSLEYLGEKHGNLSNGQKMAMDIIDNVEKLRLSFGGFWQMIHILSFLVFVAPYANYLSQILIYDRYLIGESDRAVKSSLAGALWDYIVTAGNPGGETSYAYSTVFFLMLLYNVIRMFLLFKTKHYELKQDCTGLPVVVSLDFNWRSFSGFFTIGLLHRVYKILFFVNVAAALYHMYIFAATPVSLAPRL